MFCLAGFYVSFWLWNTFIRKCIQHKCDNLTNIQIKVKNRASTPKVMCHIYLLPPRGNHYPDFYGNNFCAFLYSFYPQNSLDSLDYDLYMIVWIILYIMNFIYIYLCIYACTYIHTVWIIWCIMTFIVMESCSMDSFVFVFFFSALYCEIHPCSSSSLTLIAAWRFTAWVYHILLIHSTPDGYLDWSEFGAIAKWAILVLLVHVSWYKCAWVHSGSNLWVEWVDQGYVYFFTFTS